MMNATDAKQDIYYQKLIDLFANTLGTTVYVIQRQTEGLTHEDSLVQLPFRGNCMNWVLGHIISSRGEMLKLLNEEPALTEEENARYKSDSQPIVDDDQTALTFERLMDDLRQTTEQIQKAVKAASQDVLMEITDEEKQHTRLDALLSLMWHETYHLGQFEYLRQAAGTDDKVF